MRMLIIGIALMLVGCGQQTQPSPSPSATPQPSLGEQVPLLTAPPIVVASGEIAGCTTNYATGTLNVDKTYGAKMAHEEDPLSPHVQVPIMWPFGYTGYRVGSEVAIVDESGQVVAVTGNRYTLTPGFSNHQWYEPGPDFLVACGRVLPPFFTPDGKPARSPIGVNLPEDPAD